MKTRRLTIFLLVAFGVSWVTGLVIYLTGGLVNSPVVIPSLRMTLAILLLATIYMWAPALANIIARLATGEGRFNLRLRPYFKRDWPYWLAAWFLPGVFTVLGIVVYFLIFPAKLDRDLNTIILMMPAGSTMNPWMVVLIQTIQAMLIAPILNSLATFGEEFGWRGYLLPKLTSLGKRRALVVLGIIWGMWHWPVTVQGHNYGLNYPGYPWLGMLSMVWFTFLIGVFMGWLTFKSHSVWPAVIAHAAINGIASLGMIMVKGTPDVLLGPAPIGIIGSIPLALFALWVFLNPRALETPADWQPEERHEQALEPSMQEQHGLVGQ